MKKQVLRGVILGALATMTAGVSTMAQADGTASLDLTVNANITAGTCSACGEVINLGRSSCI